MGARPGMDGISGVQTHMTNSLNTPIEALEYAYPLRVRRYAYREGAGGNGQFRGGRTHPRNRNVGARRTLVALGAPAVRAVWPERGRGWRIWEGMDLKRQGRRNNSG